MVSIPLGFFFWKDPRSAPVSTSASNRALSGAHRLRVTCPLPRPSLPSLLCARPGAFALAVSSSWDSSPKHSPDLLVSFT